MIAIHQFVPTLSPHDAIGRHTLQLRSVLRGLGLASDIFTAEVHDDLTRDARPYDTFEPGPGRTWLLYQASTGSPVAEFVTARPEPKLLDYHNVTPPAFFNGWDPEHRVRLSTGLTQVAALARAVDLAFAHSVFNAADLHGWGCHRAVVAPVLVDRAHLVEDPDPATLESLAGTKARGGSDWLFIGRLAPNKAQHDLVKALAAYRRAYDPAARLHLVGEAASESYRATLVRFIDAVGLAGAVRLHGLVSPAALAAFYRTADVFVCVSEHEGFCVPLFEAMHHRVPIVAHAAGAVPETVGEAAVLLDVKDPATVAAAVARVLRDGDLREHLVAAGSARATEFDPSRARCLYEASVRCLLEERP